MHRHYERPVQFAPPGLFREILRADFLDALAPLVHVLRIDHAFRACADKFAPRQFLVFIPFLGNLRFQLCDAQTLLFGGRVFQPGLAWQLGRGPGRVRRRMTALRQFQQALRFLFQPAHLPRGKLHIGRSLHVIEFGQVGPGTAIRFGVATPIQIGLRQRVGLDRLRRRFRIDQHHVEMGYVFRRVEIRRRERDQQDDGVYNDGYRQRNRQDVARSGRRRNGEAGGEAASCGKWADRSVRQIRLGF